MPVPFVKILASASARFPQITTLCHSVRSCRWRFLSRYVSLVARRSLSTAWPPLVMRNSGSAPRFPSNMTRFKPSAIRSVLLSCPLARTPVKSGSHGLLPRALPLSTRSAFRGFRLGDLLQHPHQVVAQPEQDFAHVLGARVSLGRLRRGRDGRLAQLLAGPRNREALIFQQIFDAQQFFDVPPRIHPLPLARLLRADRTKLGLPVPEHVRLHADDVRDLADTVVELDQFAHRE